MTILTQQLLWGLQMEGITMPTPCDKLTIAPFNQITEELVPSVIMVGWAGRSDKNSFYSRGPYTPYIGSQTRARTRRSALQVLEVGSMVESIKTLLEWKSWAKGSEGLQHLLKVLVEEKTHLTPEELEPFSCQVYSGCFPIDSPARR